EAALAFECCVEPVEKAIESCGEAAEFIARILDWQAIVNGGFADVLGLCGHVRDGSKTLARQKIATGRSKKDCEWNQPTESDANIFQEGTFRMERGKDHEVVGISWSRKYSRVAAGAAAFARKRAKRFGRCGQ